MIRVLYEDNHLLVVEKPANQPMQEDSSGDPDLLNEAKAYVKEKYGKPGDVYLGLVHRLDRPVGGVCVFARTSKAASRLSEEIRTNRFHKVYEAVVADNGLRDSDVFIDNLKKDHRTNMVKVATDGKYSELEYEVLDRREGFAKVRIRLKTGRSHQIRVQFASRNHPLYGDQRYNKDAKPGQQIALWSSELTFKHPVKQEEMTFCSRCPHFPFGF
ncbi:MAG: RNA pseudouridine synthase [Erysipelotrichaceae bacterium]|nr:RNA pseudouridine synthase [Erysipelotrichaceae bacterium]